MMQSTQAAPKKRRFFPQPVETSSRSFRNPGKQQQEDPEIAPFDSPSPKELRTPAVQTTSPSALAASNMVRLDSLQMLSGSSTSKGTGKPIRRFKPEPVESLKLSRKPGRKEAENGADSASRLSNSLLPSPSKPLPRKFAPQLIETASRSVRSREALPRTCPHPVGNSFLLSSRTSNESFPATIAHSGILTEADHAVVRPPESRFSYDNLVKCEERRRHSFRIPDLPSIPSNSSENSDVPSLSTSPSTSSDEGIKRSKYKNRHRESCDDRFSGYLLCVAARSAENQLQDQALAAFPNEQVYNPVSHFAIDREDEEVDREDQAMEDVALNIKEDDHSLRRESIADLPYELEQLRRHKERAEGQASGGGTRSSRLPNMTRQGPNTGSPAHTTKIIGGWQKDVELAPMREAASPPMLGADIFFPFSLSPQGTKCEIDSVSLSLSQAELAGDQRSTNLWSANPRLETESMAGLWMGLCQKEQMSDEPTPKLRSGLVTPSPCVNGVSYLSPKFPSSPRSTLQIVFTPPEDHICLDEMDSILLVEQAIAREFHDAFVTQVYNYLSLGYPSLAWPYDHELSKISGISVSELRSDDLRTDAKGYVGAPEGVGVSQDGIATGQCMRWLALRLYIREWARQQPGMARMDNNYETWGVRERRGSWAI